MQSLKIIFLCITAAIVYGILHDQVTARVCVEYFTIGHPPIFDTDSPTLLAFGWGIIASWWVGLFLGIAAALTARFGPRPKLNAVQLFRPIVFLMAIMGIVSLLAGTVGYFMAEIGGVWLVEPMKSRIPFAKQSLFMADLWAHLAAYGVGFVGGIIVCVRIWLRRKRMGAA
jgi:hypothetical protein